MAEYCLKCAREVLGMTGPEIDRAVLSEDPDFCEGCGEWKQVVVSVKEPERKRGFSFLRSLFGGVVLTFCVLSLCSCGNQDSSSVKVNGPDNMEYTVTETVEDGGVHHVQIDWWEKES